MPKKVLLAYSKEHQAKEKIVDYALNLCQRMGATLEIFHLSNHQQRQITKQRYFESLTHYVEQQTIIVCTVIANIEDLNLDITEQWLITDCPLVIITI